MRWRHLHFWDVWRARFWQAVIIGASVALVTVYLLV